MWDIQMTHRYQHVPDALRRRIAGQLDDLLWAEKPGGYGGASGAHVPV
jgi:hypothetical protein